MTEVVELVTELTKYGFAAGAELVKFGAPGDFALVITTGRVAVTASGATTAELLGPGATVGELAAVLGTAHEISATAIEPVTAVAIPRHSLLAAVRMSGATAGSLARGFITALVPTLRAVLLSGETPDPEPQQHRMTLVADDPAVARQLPPTGLAITRLPFRIGRSTTRPEPGAATELTLYDRPPFKLSRRHFAIETTPDGPVVRDHNSTLGTIVNGQRIGAGTPPPQRRCCAPAGIRSWPVPTARRFALS